MFIRWSLRSTLDIAMGARPARPYVSVLLFSDVYPENSKDYSREYITVSYREAENTGATNTVLLENTLVEICLKYYVMGENVNI